LTDFRSSELWKYTLAARDNDPFSSYRDNLRVAYESFWGRATALARSISSDSPDLTLHDEAHLAALWDRASQLTGPYYPINPLEAFVFGGALLLHDAGHAFAAYEGGLGELKRTVEYRDALAALQKAKDSGGGEGESENIEKTALFATLRRLHAKQAQALAVRLFQGFFLYYDGDLRENLGQVIGRIAASHHWDRIQLDEKLRPLVQGAPSFMPQQWSIDVLKIAYLLRCADAIQIDQRRAPGVAFALHSPAETL